MTDLTDEEMLAELGLSTEAAKTATYTARQERIIAGFEDIQRFVDEYKRQPRHGENQDIFERIYAVRLDRIREQEECRALLLPLDRQGLLSDSTAATNAGLKDEEMLSELGIESSAEEPGDDILALKYVRSNAEKRAAEEIGSRTVCKDFENFKPIFLRVQKELESGVRETRVMKKPDDVEYDEIKLDEIKSGALFVVGGQKAYIAEVGEEIRNKYDRRDAKIRVVYDNGTEAEVLMRSFQRSLYRDAAARLITEASIGPLFATTAEDGDTESGTIYVLRSLSDHPTIAGNRDLIHKIGVTGEKIQERLSNAHLSATYLLADVEVVATYELFNVNRTKLEKLIHRFFTAARFDLEIKDRFGNPVRPKEWYLVPLSVIDDVVDRIRDGSIIEYYFDPTSASILRRQ